MRDLYLNMIVDISDPHCEFIKEMNDEIKETGALVYNHEYNSYQIISCFDDIDYKKEVLPELMKVQDAGKLLKALTLTINYGFDPESETDAENLQIWRELSQTELAVLKYDEDDGEVMVDHYIYLNTNNTKHTLWFLKPQAQDYIHSMDSLLTQPIIKNISIVQTLIKEYAIHPFGKDFVIEEEYNG